MAKKMNSSGQLQEYVPAGNGDASGEYADSGGSNRHFATFAKPLPSNFNQPSQSSKPHIKNQKQDDTPLKQDTSTKDNIGTFDLNKVKNGKNLLESGNVKLDYNKYTYGIESAMEQQGFDGLPQIVDQKTFDEMVKKSNFIAQRGVGAPTKATLDAYTQQLYQGKWYVDCSTGGAQYGQGMYCVGNYNGQITAGMESEVADYSGKSRNSSRKRYSRIEQFTLTPDAKIIEHQDIINQLIEQAQDNVQIRSVMLDNLYNFANLGNRNKGELQQLYYDSMPSIKILHDAIRNVSQSFLAGHPTEQKLRDLESYKKLAMHEIEYRLFGNVRTKYKLTAQEQQYLETKDGISYSFLRNKARDVSKEIIRAEYIKNTGMSNFGRDQTISEVCAGLGFNDGTLATLMGYDAIKATGHGQGSQNGEESHYTVILNRTKCAFLKQ